MVLVVIGPNPLRVENPFRSRVPTIPKWFGSLMLLLSKERSCCEFNCATFRYHAWTNELAIYGKKQLSFQLCYLRIEKIGRNS